MNSGFSEKNIKRIYHETFEPLFGSVVRLCASDRTLVEDVTQETWLRALDSWSRKGVPDDPLAWLICVARNIVLNHFRRKKPTSLHSIPRETVLAVVDDGYKTDSLEIAYLVNWALAQLPTSQASMLQAYYLEDRSVADLASEWGITDKAVEGRLRRARMRLRERLERIPEIDGGNL